ncbi:MAG: hypothetical protein V4671_02140 [Armatimonadota bacterium]
MMDKIPAYVNPDKRLDMDVWWGQLSSFIAGWRDADRSGRDSEQEIDYIDDDDSLEFRYQYNFSRTTGELLSFQWFLLNFVAQKPSWESSLSSVPHSNGTICSHKTLIPCDIYINSRPDVYLDLNKDQVIAYDGSHGEDLVIDHVLHLNDHFQMVLSQSKVVGCVITSVSERVRSTGDKWSEKVAITGKQDMKLWSDFLLFLCAEEEDLEVYSRLNEELRSVPETETIRILRAEFEERIEGNRGLRAAYAERGLVYKGDIYR